MTSGRAQDVKACCSAAYGGAAARYLLGESFHPGGTDLTLTLVRELALGPGDLLVDVASGRGTSALLAARETGCDVIGVDLAPENVAEATAAAATAGLRGEVRFVVGDAERLPLDDGRADAALCECSLCLFPDAAAAVAEIARALRPGGLLALSDVVIAPGGIGPEMRDVAGWVACLANARPIEDVVGMLQEAGLDPRRVERHDRAIGETVDRVEARLRLARALGAAVPAEVRDGARRGLELVAAARRALADGTLGYGVVVARRR
ncbi:MAG: methyltransferase domain-containing protein [Actinomycetota bacterium]